MIWINEFFVYKFHFSFGGFTFALVFLWLYVETDFVRFKKIYNIRAVELAVGDSQVPEDL